MAICKAQLQWSSQRRGIVFECGWTILRLTRDFFQKLHNAFTFQVFQGGRWLGCLPTVARKAPPLPQHLDDSGSNSSSDSKLSMVWKLPYCTSIWCTRNDLLHNVCILLFFPLYMNHNEWQPAYPHSSRRPHMIWWFQPIRNIVKLNHVPGILWTYNMKYIWKPPPGEFGL